MLTQLELRNFKSWEGTQPVRLAPVTALFGTNSSGKTSLLQSLLLLRQTTESPDRSRVLDLSGPNALVDLGTYQDIAHGHASSSRMHIGIKWQADKELRVVDLLEQAKKQQSTLIASRQFGLDAEIDIQGNSAEVADVTYSLGEARFSLRRRERKEGFDLLAESFNFVRAPGRVWPLPEPTRFYGFPDQVRLYYQNASFLTDLELRFEEACAKFRYLGPLRDDPRRQYIFSGGLPGDVGRRGEFSVDTLIAARIKNLKVSRGYYRHGAGRRRRPAIPLEQLIAEWLWELGLIESFTLESLDDRNTVYRVMVRRTAGSVPVLLTDVGFGVSQVLPVLVLLGSARQGDTIILEQPEIHLHPAVQSGLADVILETALARGVQVILESHSEHLLNRLQRRIAEKDIANGMQVATDDVALYFCSQEAGVSRLHELEIDSYGSILNWPKDFFGNSLEDSVRRVTAAAKRQGAQA